MPYGPTCARSEPRAERETDRTGGGSGGHWPMESSATILATQEGVKVRQRFSGGKHLSTLPPPAAAARGHPSAADAVAHLAAHVRENA